MPSKTYVDFPESLRTLPAGAQRLGDVAPDENIEVSVYLNPRPHTGPADEALRDIDHRAALRARRAVQHEDDIRLLTEFAIDNGLTVSEVDPARRLVKLSGPASKMQAAFGTTLGVYHDGKQQFRARTGVLRLPQDVLPVVESVLGLDTRPAARPLFVRVEGGVDPKVITAHLPNAVGTLYSFPAGLTGAGQSIGIVELGGGYNPPDITAAFRAMGLAAPTVVAVSVDGGQNAPGDPAYDPEVALDIQVAGGVAPGSRIAVYFAPNTFRSWVDAVTQAAQDSVNAPSVISISLGAEEMSWSAMGRNSMNTALQDAAQVGVSVFVACGDSLATNGINDGRAHVDFPASSPWAIGCGGTTIDTTGNTINSEVVWNDGGVGTGGGISDFFPVPAFQQSANLPVSVNDGQHRRGVPDVAADASPYSGYLIVLNGSTVDPPMGGTSAVAPLWAGLTALVNQAASVPIGFFLPKLYQNPQVMRDITQGDNKPTGSNLGYTAGPGWDACTGLGAPNGSAFLKAAAIRCLGWENAVAEAQAAFDACASDPGCPRSALRALGRQLRLTKAGLQTCEHQLIG